MIDLEIALFKYPNISSTIKASKSRIMSKEKNPFIPEFSDLHNCDTIKKILADDSIPIIDRKLLISSLNAKDRTYSKVFNCDFDSHFVLESLGLAKSDLNYFYIVSLEDSLDLILNILGDTEIGLIKTMANYRDISRSLIRLNGDRLDYNLEDFINLGSTKLNNILVSIDSNSDDFNSFINNFVNEITEQVNRVLEYIAYYLKNQIPDLVIRSFESGKVLFGSVNKIDLDLIKVKYTNDVYLTDLVVNVFNRFDVPDFNFVYDVGRWD